MSATMSFGSQPLVSVIVPCYNCARWVTHAIELCLNQTYPNIEVIVVDDGSTDGSLEVLRQFLPRIRLETGPNRGGNFARNRGFKLSKGQYIQYLDADDYLEPDKIFKTGRVSRGKQRLTSFTVTGGIEDICETAVLAFLKRFRLAESIGILFLHYCRAGGSLRPQSYTGGKLSVRSVDGTKRCLLLRTKISLLASLCPVRTYSTSPAVVTFIGSTARLQSRRPILLGGLKAIVVALRSPNCSWPPAVN